MGNGDIKGLRIEDSQLVNELFADETNFLINSGDESVKNLWSKIDIFSKASGSRVIPSKASYYETKGRRILQMEEKGCTVIERGEFLRLMGISWDLER